MTFILASTSLRRKELLGRIYSDFEVIESPFDENTIVGLPPIDLCRTKCQGKGYAVYNVQKQLVISSDTIVYMDGKIYEKPRSKQESIQQLTELSNKKHIVYTAASLFVPTIDEKVEQEILQTLKSFQYCLEPKIIQHANGKEISFVGQCYVKFRAIQHQVILKYVETQEPYDKAAGYGIQQTAGQWVESVEGDYFTIVGLPLSFICAILDILTKK